MSFCFSWAMVSGVDIGEEGVVGVDVNGISGGV